MLITLIYCVIYIVFISCLFNIVNITLIYNNKSKNELTNFKDKYAKLLHSHFTLCSLLSYSRRWMDIPNNDSSPR